MSLTSLCLTVLFGCVMVIRAQWNERAPQVYDGSTWISLDMEQEYAVGHPPRPVFNIDAENSIYIGISSFRDAARCGNTVFLLFDKARDPTRVRVGVVDQKDDTDQECLEVLLSDRSASLSKFGVNAQVFCALETDKHGSCVHKKQAQSILVDANESKGPVFARAKQVAMFQNEEFCMQVDAHSQFVDNWDDELIAEWMLTENEYGVLSTYVHNIDRLPINHLHHDVPIICRTKWGEGGMVRNEQAGSALRLPRPKLTMSWGAGFSFSKCHAAKRVQYDPHLPQVFDGEEFSIAYRLFTHGYDVYTPHRNMVFHDYSPVPRHWSTQIDHTTLMREKQASWARLRTLWHMPDASGEDLGEYGAGSCRTFEQFVAFSGVDTRIKKASNGTQCGTLQWVPWNNNCWPEDDRAVGSKPNNVVDKIDEKNKEKQSDSGWQVQNWLKKPAAKKPQNIRQMQKNMALDVVHGNDVRSRQFRRETAKDQLRQRVRQVDVVLMVLALLAAALFACSKLCRQRAKRRDRKNQLHSIV